MIRTGIASPRLPFLLAAIAIVSPLSAQFTKVGKLATPRSEVTAVTLADGRILVAGGLRNYGTHTGPVAAAEFFSMRKGSQTAAPMVQARFGHTLTLLANGKVLATGGSYADSNARYFAPPMLATAEIFDPATGKWKTTGDMTRQRNGHAATLLSDSKVLVVGDVAEAEVYTPSTGKFAFVAKLNLPRLNPKLVNLKDGRVLVLGMANCEDSTLARRAEIFNPKTKTFTLVGAMSNDRNNRFTATLLQDGRVLVAGGDTDTTKEGTYELFDPTTGQFTFLGHMNTDREGHTAAVLQDGSVMIIGGHGCVNRVSVPNNGGIVPPLSGPLSSVERFFTSTMAADVTNNLVDGRWGHGTFFLKDSLYGSVVVLGGEAGKGSLDTIEAMTWR